MRNNTEELWLEGGGVRHVYTDDYVEALEQQRDALLSWKFKHERFAAIGAAVERACAELPEGVDLYLELEKGAGTVRLYLADDDASLNDFGGDDFPDQIHNAINIAIAKFDTAETPHA